MSELVTCTRCHSEIEAKYFSINRKGVRQKTCDTCLARYQCDQCEYVSSTKRNINKHIKTVHLKLTPYSCGQCDAKFGQNGNLQRHINTVHLKEQNYACTECDAKFGQNGNLQTHIKICTGEFNGSAGEYAILNLLDELGQEKDVDFIYNSTHWNVKDKSLLRWDFILNHLHDNPMVIEFDGIAHFLPTRFGGISEEKAQENLITAQRRDKIKNDYCLEYNIPILRIPYWDFDKIESLVMNFIASN